MAHFAQIENNIVTRVLAVDNSIATDEAAGIAHLTEMFPGTSWKQTSYNGNVRHNFAGIGFIYDPMLDAFYPPRPYPSWTLDENCVWQPPVARPNHPAVWDEQAQEWV